MRKDDLEKQIDACWICSSQQFFVTCQLFACQLLIAKKGQEMAVAFILSSFNTGKTHCQDNLLFAPAPKHTCWDE